jgi:hypothetical protein
LCGPTRSGTHQQALPQRQQQQQQQLHQVLHPILPGCRKPSTKPCNAWVSWQIGAGLLPFGGAACSAAAGL